VAQPIRFAYPLSLSLIAEQVQNLQEETKGNHMLIPIFHALFLCSPKEGITNRSSFSLYLIAKLYPILLRDASSQKRNLKFWSPVSDKFFSLINYIFMLLYAECLHMRYRLLVQNIQDPNQCRLCKDVDL
jgi:hypothetical protein